MDVLKTLGVLAMFLALSGIMIGALWLVFPPAAVTPSVALGNEFGPAFLAVYADAWDAAADAVESGQTVSDATLAMEQARKRAECRLMSTKAAPVFEKIVPYGAEPSPAQRAELAKLWREFAQGLRSCGK